MTDLHPGRKAALGTLVFVSAMLAGTHIPRSTGPSVGQTNDAPISPAVRSVPGRQLVFVYVGASTCGPSNTPGLAELVTELRDSVAARSRRSGLGFVSIGIAREANPKLGLKHLQQVGDFDELAVGQGGLNQASAHYISRDLAGLPATPQLIVTVRTLRRLGNGVDFGSYDERVLLRRIGTEQIAGWVATGGVLPVLEAPTPQDGATPEL